MLKEESETITKEIAEINPNRPVIFQSLQDAL